MSDNQTIIRVQKDKSNPYVMMNKGFLENQQISWKAKGILAYVLSKPDNWKVILSHLYKQSPDGEKSVRAGFNELKKFNYIMKYPVYKDNRVHHWETIIFETPFTEDQRITSKKMTVEELVEETKAESVLAQKGKVVAPVLSHFVKVQNVKVQNAVLLNNNRLVINECLTNQPTKEEKMVERLDGILDSIDYAYLDNQGIDQEFVKTAKKVITDLFFTDTELKINGSKLPAIIVQRQLHQIDAYKLEYVYTQFKEEAKMHPITNEDAYLRSMIYNSLSSDYLKLTANVQYSALGLGRS